MKKKIKRMCIIADNYPDEMYPKNPFIDQLVVAFAELGIECTVINPVSITAAVIRNEVLKPKRWIKKTASSVIKIYSPRYLTFSSQKYGLINTNVLNLFLFQRSCMRVLREIESNFDVVYGHFIFPAGISANKISNEYKIPAFFAYGENTNYTIDYLGINKTKEMLRGIKGVIAVSTANKENLIKQDIVHEDKIGVFPNAINNVLFYKRDKSEMRKKYGLPREAFIVAFVGRFIEIKGANRLSKAIEKVGSEKVKSIFIGSGDVGPTCNGILLEGKQPHEKIPEILSTADIFALPTLAEGCCNAIVEAMACGLPIISSNRSFNDDILDETCSIKIDPLNIDEISEAIKLLYENKKLRGELSKGALEKAQSFKIGERARRIIDFMEDNI